MSAAEKIRGPLPLVFSHRTGWDLTPNAFAEARRRFQAGGVPLLDLTESNPTRAGFHYPEEIFRLLADPGARRYDPEPLGLFPAREAVARLFAEKGARVRPEQVMLTASTSEAYGILFRILADSGETVLIPAPSYPLFQYLADLSDIRTASYPLRWDPRAGWRIDFQALETAAGRGAKALVVVHPNNPTGSALRKEELDRLVRLCRDRRMALISDEVFGEYLFSSESTIPPTLLIECDTLIFALGGLSKFMGLPQMKLAWTACAGPEEQVKQALTRWEMVADTLLSVNTPAQRALPDWLRRAGPIQRQIRERVEQNLRTLAEKCRSGNGRLLPMDGGWNAVLKSVGLRSWEEEERWALALLDAAHTLVYPGAFFDFEDPGHFVVSLLAEPKLFNEGIDRLIQRFP